MILWILLAALGAQDAPAGTTVDSDPVEVPTSIGPAVRPYFDCMTNTVQTESQAAGEQHADGFRIIVATAQRRCAPVRARSRKLALKRIEGNTETDRAARVDRTLESIDHVADSLIQAIERMDREQAAGSQR